MSVCNCCPCLLPCRPPCPVHDVRDSPAWTPEDEQRVYPRGPSGRCGLHSREVAPSGRTTQGVAEAVGAAALDLLAQHGAEGHVLEVRLVRREGARTPCLTYQEPEHGARCRACGGSRADHDGRKARATDPGAPRPRLALCYCHRPDGDMPSGHCVRCGGIADRARVAGRKDGDT